MVEFHQHLTTDQSPDQVVSSLIKTDARNLLFRWEGLCRVYETIYPGRLKIGSRTMHEVVKEHEDALGHYDDCVKAVAVARTLKAPASVISVLKEIRDVARSDYKQLLAEHWTSGPNNESVISQCYSILLNIDWLPEEEENEAIFRTIRKEIKEIDFKKDYDLSSPSQDAHAFHDALECGMHRLRRKLRWILIYLQALDGLVVLDEASPHTKIPVLKLNEYSYLLTHPIASGPYSQLKRNHQIQSPVVVPRYLFLTLSKIVADLGEIKSQGERVIALTTGFEACSQALDPVQSLEMANKVLKKSTLAPYADVFKSARSIRRELERTGLLKVFRRALG